MASSRAAEVAELLWELKRADKVATYTILANRAGFSPGANGRTMVNCIKVVRRDWPHLQWWRAVKDDGTIPRDSEQLEMVVDSGFEVEDHDDDHVVIKSFEEVAMIWEEQAADK